MKNYIICFFLGIHAREWISPAVTTYAIDQLINNGEANADLLDHFDWYLMPSHNPDGYTFTIEHVRFKDTKEIFEVIDSTYF